MVVHVRHLPHHAKKRGNFTMSSGFRGVLALKLTLIIPRQCKTTMTTRTTSSRPPPETTRAPQDPTKETRNCFPPGTGAFREHEFMLPLLRLRGPAAHSEPVPPQILLRFKDFGNQIAILLDRRSPLHRSILRRGDEICSICCK